VVGEGIFFSLTPCTDQFWDPSGLILNGFWGLSLRVKQAGHETYHPLSSSAEVKDLCSYTFTPPIYLHGMMLS